ncbi:metallophosphoesterase [Thermodesulfobacteriota bacterium]
MQEKTGITRRSFIRLCLLGAIGIAGAKGFINSHNLKLLKLNVNLDNLPTVFNGLKIGQITDIHAGPLVPRDLIKEGVDLIMSSRPDLIVLTGDFVSGATKILWTTYGGFKERHYQYCMEELHRLNASLGIFAVLGNHDFWSGSEVAEKIADGLKNIGVRVLRNESQTLKRRGESLNIIGVDDYWESSYRFSTAIRGVPKGACRILISHNPDVNEDIENMKENIDLIISGHTHGGQVVLPFAGALYTPSPFGQKYLAGLVKDRKKQTYVSRGLGLFFAPIRLNCPPDVSVLTLSQA